MAKAEIPRGTARPKTTRKPPLVNRATPSRAKRPPGKTKNETNRDWDEVPRRRLATD